MIIDKLTLDEIEKKKKKDSGKKTSIYMFLFNPV